MNENLIKSSYYLNVFQFKFWQLFAVYVFLYTALTWLANSLIYTDSFYFSALSFQFSEDRIAQIIEIGKRTQVIKYAFLPLLLVLKFAAVGGVIYIGLFLFNQDLSFENCFKVVMVAELSPLVVTIIKILFFLLKEPETLQQINFFYPLSIIQFFSPNQISPYLIYPLQQFNLFEVAYWLLIAAGIQIHIQKSFAQSFKIVVSSYGLALGIWVLCVVFIQLQFT